MSEKLQWPKGETVEIAAIYQMRLGCFYDKWTLAAADVSENMVRMECGSKSFTGTFQDFKEIFTLLP